MFSNLESTLVFKSDQDHQPYLILVNFLMHDMMVQVEIHKNENSWFPKKVIHRQQECFFCKQVKLSSHCPKGLSIITENYILFMNWLSNEKSKLKKVSGPLSDHYIIN